MSNPALLSRPFESLWTPREVAEFLQLSRSWVYQHAEAGKLPCIRIGGALRFEPEAIRAWVKQASRASEPAKLVSAR